MWIIGGLMAASCILGYLVGRLEESFAPPEACPVCRAEIRR